MLLTKENLEKLSKKIIDGMHNQFTVEVPQYEYKFSVNEVRLIQKLIDDAYNKIGNN